MFERQVEALKRILAEVESHEWNELYNIEFKTNFVSEEDMCNELGITICAIANGCTYKGEEQGYIVLGVEDQTGMLVGTNVNVFDIKRGNQDCQLWLRSKLVGVEFDFEPFSYEGKNFLLIKVSKSIGQIAKFDKEAYIRLGKYNKKLQDCDSEVQQKLNFCVRQSVFWNRAIIDVCSPGEIMSILDCTAYYALTEKHIPEDFSVVLSDFEDEGFIKSNTDGSFIITYLGGLLFAKDLNRHEILLDKRIRITTYDGKNKLSSAIQDRYISKGYASSFLEAIQYIGTQVPATQVITGGLRSTVSMYPEVAIREFLANCLVHQDFLENGVSPTIEIYEDRMEFFNAGNCSVDVMKILNTVPKRRNEKLVDIMRRMSICESRASGMARALNAIWEQKLPTPVFSEGEKAFMVKMYNFRNYDELTEEQKLYSCYYYTCYCYAMGEKANNTTLRDLFGVRRQNYPMISRLIKKCVERNLIKEFDPLNSSKKFKSYIPNWVR